MSNLHVVASGGNAATPYYSPGPFVDHTDYLIVLLVESLSVISNVIFLLCYSFFWEAAELVAPSDPHRGAGRRSEQHSSLESLYSTLA
jgi:hypothetical protein